MIKQEELLWKLDWDTLIVLDACRYDYFENEFYTNPCDGVLSKVYSPQSQTYKWLPHMFPYKYDIDIYSAHPGINSKGIARNGGSWVANEHFNKIEDIWDYGWDNDLGTVHPTVVGVKVVDDILKGDYGSKNIIWFMQPHFPWIGEGYPRAKAEFVNDKRTNKEIWADLVGGKFSVDLVREAYSANVEVVWDTVQDMLPLLDGQKVVVTADHGELLGEYPHRPMKKQFGHWPEMETPELREVPWLEMG